MCNILCCDRRGEGKSDSSGLSYISEGDKGLATVSDGLRAGDAVVLFGNQAPVAVSALCSLQS